VTKRNTRLRVLQLRQERKPDWRKTADLDDYLYPPHPTMPASRNALPGEAKRKHLIGDTKVTPSRDVNKTNILWPNPGELSSGNSEQMLSLAPCYVQGRVVRDGRPSPKIQVNRAPALCLSPHLQEAGTAH